MKIFDTLSSTDASVTVIDVRAGLLSPTLRALRDIGFLDAVKKGQLNLLVFHILGSSIASLNEIEEMSRLRRRRQIFPGEEFHQQHQLLRVGPGDLCVLFQEVQGCGGDLDPEAQRDGLRAGRTGFGAVPHLRRQQEHQAATRRTTRSCCAAMSGTGWAMSGPSTTASSSTRWCRAAARRSPRAPAYRLSAVPDRTANLLPPQTHRGKPEMACPLS